MTSTTLKSVPTSVQLKLDAPDRKAHTINTMTDDQFTRLFKHMTERFDTLEAKLETKAAKTDVDRLYSLVDSRLKTSDDEVAEHAALVHQVDRHERQIQQLGDQAGLTLAS